CSWFVPLLLVCKAAVALPSPGELRLSEGVCGSPPGPRMPCCPIPSLAPIVGVHMQVGHGPVCTPCSPPGSPVLPCCPEPPLNPKFGLGPVCTRENVILP
ncbi:hypothetical protein BD779DRAFT_1547324, partial [Infundibulicybe gibba]